MKKRTDTADSFAGPCTYQKKNRLMSGYSP